MPALAYDLSGMAHPMRALAQGAEADASLVHAHVVMAEECVEAIRRGAGLVALVELEGHLERAHAACDGWPSYLERMARGLEGRLRDGWMPPAGVPCNAQLRLLGEDVA